MNDIAQVVAFALAEDIGSGDISAALLPKHLYGCAAISAKEPGLVCGRPWVEEVFRQVDNRMSWQWLVEEGSYQSAPGIWLTLKGPLSSILTAERTALNFLQTLSGVATKTKDYVDILKKVGSPTTLLDTRKTIPGLRVAEKYAVRCGGAQNHRMGLYDAYLIKENHIASMGSITQAIQAIQLDKPIVVEVENIAQFLEAKRHAVSRIMLDNFSDSMILEAIALNQQHPCPIEVSGGIDSKRLRYLAKIGVDYVSVGDLTKSVQAIDLSLLLTNTGV
jgi:nicotinate-nucleotide pyrophosphorylase (carboxylating)